jgi:hypothetical protein
MAIFGKSGRESQDYDPLTVRRQSAHFRPGTREPGPKRFITPEWSVYEIVLALVAGLAAFRYGWRFVVPDTHDPSPPCEPLASDERHGSGRSEGKP